MKNPKKPILTGMMLMGAALLGSACGKKAAKDAQTVYGPPPVSEETEEEPQDVYGPPPSEATEEEPQDVYGPPPSEDTEEEPQAVYGPPSSEEQGE